MTFSEQQGSGRDMRIHDEEKKEHPKLNAAEEATLKKFIETIEYLIYYYHANDALYKEFCDAQEALLILGNKALPYLAQDITPKNCVTYAEIFNALAKEEDIDLIIATLHNDALQGSHSSVAELCKALTRFILSLREKNPDDPRLHNISTKLIALRLKMVRTSSLNASFVLNPLCATGTAEARQHLERTPFSLSANNQILLNTPQEFSAQSVAPHHLYTWNEVLEERASEAYENSYENFQLSPDTSHLVARINNLAILQDETIVEPTARDAIKLHLFNFITAHQTATEEDLLQELATLNRLSTQEKEFSSAENPLPSIGIEIEMPTFSLTPERVAILNALGIPHYKESEPKLWEVNARFSYSPWTQARLLQELAMLGAIPLTEEANNTTRKVKKVPKDEALSLHINFGLPPEINTNEFKKPLPSFSTLNAILTYAFVSPQRLYKRKTTIAFAVTDDNVNANKKMASPPPDTQKKLFRLELRATEFRDFPTFRLLVESQRLVAMLISHLKEKHYTPMTALEKKLAKYWDEFFIAAKILLKKFNLEDTDMVDSINANDEKDTTKIKALTTLLTTTDLKKECRRLITHHSAAVAKLLKNELPQK